MDVIQKELKEFIVTFCEKMKINNIDLEGIDLDTSIDLDLNIFDIDLDVFMNDFSKHFKVDLSEFVWGDIYIYPSGDDMSLFYMAFRSFNFRKDWVKRLCRRSYKPKLFVRDLQDILLHGV